VFRTFARRFFPSPLDRICKRAARRKVRRILLTWNRGLGDIPLGLYAIVHRIRSFLPEAEITFLIRKDLQEGFSLFPGVRTLIASDWKRGEPIRIAIDKSEFDLVIPDPKPSDWVVWQYGRLTPRLVWNPLHEQAAGRFLLPKQCVALHVHAETGYGLWRNWPEGRVREFLVLAKRNQIPTLLLGLRKQPFFEEATVDLRGETSLLELLAIVKTHCRALVAPDSGILSMVYYLDTSFPLRVVSLWADPKHGILKQNVLSPNAQLRHQPLIAPKRDLSFLSAEKVFSCAMR
jgi:ADP-heptose:LPS heptosyltransferase